MGDGLIDILPSLNESSAVGGPLYVKLQRLIENAVREGKLLPGDALPPERELAAMAEISRVTVRKAVQGLVNDGLLVQRHGSGTFVAPRSARVEQSLSHLTSFTEDMARRGMIVRSTWLDRGVYAPSPEEMVTLGLSSGEKVARISRLRVANDTPMAIERAALSIHVLPNPELVTLSLYAVLAESGNRPVRAIQRISAAILKENDAKLLQVPAGSASLNIERISYLESGKVIEFTRSIYRADAYEFVAELKLGEFFRNFRSSAVNTKTTLMREEIRSIPDVTAKFLDASRATLAAAGAKLREKNPPFLASIARGSSDHVSAFLKYSSELTAGIPVASLGPSVASIYGVKLKLGSAATLSISQSGRSPDIVSMTNAARESGALTIAITNVIESDLARASDFAIDILAGPERSVAATKSFVSSAVAGLALIGHWTEDSKLLAAIDDLPAALAKAVACDWSAFAGAVTDENSLFVLGRGPSLAIANEMALKFKETSAVHAEAFSAAEVMHGPKAIVGEGFPILVLAARDAAEDSLVDAANRLADQGAAVFLTSSKSSKATALPFVATSHPLTDPLALLVSFYAFVEGFARSRGLNPDEPPHLRKVTETL